MYAALSSRQGVLTGSVSWDVETPYLFDHFEVAMGRWLSDGLEPNQPLVLLRVGRSVDSIDSSDGAADPGA